MKKNNGRNSINLFFSAFLVIATIICAYFFSQFTQTLGLTVGSIITSLLYVVFGLILFYATRVGDGKACFRFSITTLIIMVIPSLYIIIASLASGMPLHNSFAATSTGNVNLIVSLAGVALGYGIPYTFVSGFELADEVSDDEADTLDSDENEVLEGGLEESLMSDSKDNNSEKTED